MIRFSGMKRMNNMKDIYDTKGIVDIFYMKAAPGFRTPVVEKKKYS